MNRPVWDDREWPPLPKLTGTQRADVCVVGLGASGLAAMEELAAQGVAAVGLDAYDAGAGAAGRNGGFLLAGLAKFFNETLVQFGEAAARDFHRLTAAEIRRQAEDLPAIVRLTGSLRIAADEAEQADCAKHLAALRYCGFEAGPTPARKAQACCCRPTGWSSPCSGCGPWRSGCASARSGSTGIRPCARSCPAPS
jgi:gamma-glutamylputrescine oxidase